MSYLRRRAFITLLGAAAWPVAARAQPSGVARIGFLSPTSPSSIADRMESLRAGFRDLGYVEGRTLLIEFRWADGHYDRLASLAADLVRLNVDVIVTHTTPGVVAAQRATSTIPIVMAATGDALASGLIVSLARPGGNVTGSTFLGPDVNAKRLEIIRDALPHARAVGALLNPDNAASGPVFQAMKRSSEALGVSLKRYDFRGLSDLERAFTAMADDHIQAVVTNEDVVIGASVKAIADRALKHRIAAVAGRDLVRAGGLLGYTVDIPELFRRSALFVDKLLRGTKVDELPVELPTKFELVLNLKTARALGLEVSPTLLARADEVIE
jgi:putative ABC transport system substrate-binding protein